MNPDKLRMNDEVIGFISGFFDDGKPIAAICHGPWTLIETGELKGRIVTSYPSLKTDLINAGANISKNFETARPELDNLSEQTCEEVVKVVSNCGWHGRSARRRRPARARAPGRRAVPCRRSWRSPSRPQPFPGPQCRN